jgi:hypothetical protein
MAVSSVAHLAVSRVAHLAVSRVAHPYSIAGASVQGSDIESSF